jgi:hypothetical protein
MATIAWETVAQVWCGRAAPAALMEERVYAADWLNDASAPFQVRARKCSLEAECREAGLACRWTGFNPNYDPFAA